MSERNFGLDFARASAIGLVLLCHFLIFESTLFNAIPPALANATGVLGVEIFFVLSGYLIGGLLMDSAANWRAWVVFMLRRWARTLPAYTAVVALVFLAAPAGGDPFLRLLRYLTFTQNLLWPMPADPRFLAVTWSLSVEEWFYLLFSALYLCCAARGRGRGWVAIGGFLAVPLLCRLLIAADLDWDEHIRKVALLRLDAIAYGVAMIGLRRGGSALFDYPLSCLAVGVALLIGSSVAIGAAATAGSIAGRALIFNATSIGIALCFPALLRMRRPKRWVVAAVESLAKYSYGIYLIHFPLMIVLSSRVSNNRLVGAALIAGAVPAAIALAYVSYHWFEAPILRLRPRSAAAPLAA